MTKTVRKTPTNHKLAATQKGELRRLARRPDSEINYSDISRLREKFWENAVRNPFYRNKEKSA
jgi:hypothetical protein